MKRTSGIGGLIIVLVLLALNLFSPVTADADCTPAPAGLVSWWPAEGNADDIIGGNNGTLMNGAGFTNGEVGMAFNLNGANNFVLINPSTNLDVGQGSGFTIEGWIAPTTLSQTMLIMEYERALATQNGSDVGVQFGINSASPGCFDANIKDINGGNHIASSPSVLTAGVWQHIALTYDEASGILVFYLNGLVVSQTNLTSYTPETDFTNLLIGARTTFNSVANPNAVFSGGIDELSFYKRALSLSEIQFVYNAGSEGKCAPLLAIGEQPSNQTTVEGSNVVLSVTATGVGPFSYQWSFDGVKISGATNVILALDNLHLNQSGNYAVTITTTNGVITSSNAVVTVIAQNILVYNYSGNEAVTTTGSEFSYAYAGRMFFIPDSTNGTFVGWAMISGKKQYWVSAFSDYLLASISGSQKRVYTVLGKAGTEVDANGQPHIWAYLHKGQNTVLTIGTKKYFSFPSTFSCDDTHVYPDSQTGDMILREASSTYTFVAQSTQTANNTGQTITDLVNAQIKTLENQGYKRQ